MPARDDGIFCSSRRNMLPLLHVDHSDAKERARYHRKAVVVHAPDQATVDEKFVEFPGAWNGGWVPLPNFAPNPQSPIVS
jgi:hypothetical protein